MYHHANKVEKWIIWYLLKWTGNRDHGYLCWCGCTNLWEFIISVLIGKEYSSKGNPFTKQEEYGVQKKRS